MASTDNRDIGSVVVNDDHSPDRKNSFDEKTVGPVHHEELTDEQAAHRLKLFRKVAVNDPNIDVNDLDAVDYAVDGHNATKENHLVDELVENSPYPEVRFPPVSRISFCWRLDS